MAARIHPNEKHADVEFLCGECKTPKTLEFKEFNARTNRTYCGYLFCSRECARKFNQKGHAERLRLAHQRKRDEKH